MAVPTFRDGWWLEIDAVDIIIVAFIGPLLFWVESFYLMSTLYF